MEFVKKIKASILAFSCFVGAGQALAENIQIDFSGTVINTYVLSNADETYQHDASSWSLGELISIDSLLNFKFSYDTSMPASGYEESGKSVGWYKGRSVSLSSNGFQAATSAQSTIGITVVDGLFQGWDGIYVNFSDSGIKVTFGSDDYYLMSGTIRLDDESELSLVDSSLPTDQATLDAFWLNKPVNPYWAHLAKFDLQFVKDPHINSWDNSSSLGYWPVTEAFYVVGYFDNANLSKIPAPEPGALALLLVGMLGFLGRKRHRTY